MAIKLPKETRDAAVASIKRYFAEHLESSCYEPEFGFWKDVKTTDGGEPK